MTSVVPVNDFLVSYDATKGKLRIKSTGCYASLQRLVIYRMYVSSFQIMNIITIKLYLLVFKYTYFTCIMLKRSGVYPPKMGYGPKSNHSPSDDDCVYFVIFNFIIVENN